MPNSFYLGLCIKNVSPAGIVLPHYESQQLFEEAMKKGYVTSRITKMILYGAAGAGKTSFRNLLVGEPPPSIRVSTPLAVRPTALYRYEVSDGEWQNLSFEERKDYLSRAIMAQAPKLQPLFEAGTESSSTVPSLHKDPIASSTADTEVDSSATTSSEEVDSSATTSSEDSLLKSITTDEELVALIESISGSKPLASYSMFQIIDSGGQPQFHEIFPIFLRQLSCYVFVFRLSDDLTSRNTVELYDESGKVVGVPYTSAHSNEQLLQHCLQALQSHKSSKVEGERARILILGTHKDEESKCATETRQEKDEKVQKLLLPTFKHEAVYSGVNRQLIFAVNAKSPTGEDQKVVDEIRQLVMKDISTKSADIPLRWYALELLLEEMTHTLGRGVLSWKECLAAASSKLLFDEKSLKAALVFLDGLSVVFHYKDILPDSVFANPQVLLDKASELVKAKYEVSTATCVVHVTAEEWQKFNDNALVSLAFLSQEKFKKHYVSGIFSPADLIVLFRKLFIFADFNEEEFFMPALLDVLEENEIDSHRVSLSSFLPPLVVEFPHCVPLLGVFCALTSFLSSEKNTPWCLETSDTLKPACLFRNCIQFSIPQYHCSVVLIESMNRFECHVTMPKAVFKRKSKTVCSSIRRALEKGLQEAYTALGYSSLQYSTTLLCPCGEGKAHSATVEIEDGLWICGNKSSEELTPSQMIWFEGSNDLGATGTVCTAVCCFKFYNCALCILLRC